MKRIIRWTASYETVVEGDTEQEIQDAAANIPVDVPGSRYMTDTWEVENINRNPTAEELEEHEALKD